MKALAVYPVRSCCHSLNLFRSLWQPITNRVSTMHISMDILEPRAPEGNALMLILVPHKYISCVSKWVHFLPVTADHVSSVLGKKGTHYITYNTQAPPEYGTLADVGGPNWPISGHTSCDPQGISYWILATKSHVYSPGVACIAFINQRNEVITLPFMSTFMSNAQEDIWHERGGHRIIVGDKLSYNANAVPRTKHNHILWYHML